VITVSSGCRQFAQPFGQPDQRVGLMFDIDFPIEFN